MTLAPHNDSDGVAVFFSVHELGWKTWARQLEAHSASTLPGALHVPLATPLAVRILARPLPWPVRRPVITERAYYTRTLRAHLARISALHKIAIVIASSQRIAPCLVPFCKQNDVPLAICLDTTGPAYMRDLLHQSLPPHSAWAEEQSIYDFADVLVPWSTWAMRSLVDEFHIAPEKIQLSPPGVAVPQSIPARASRPGEPANILFVGNDWQRKGGHRLVEWHQTHFKDKARLHIASAKAPRQNLPNVTFHGAVPHSRLLAELLPQMDLFCLPTQHDMSPFAIAEAQAVGLPVVSTNIAGIPDLVQHNRSGYLHDPTDDSAFINSLHNLITIPELRRQMSAAARTHAKEFLDAKVTFPRLMQKLASRQHTPELTQLPITN